MGSGTSFDLKQLKTFLFHFFIANETTKPTTIAVGKKILVRLFITTGINNYKQFFKKVWSQSFPELTFQI